MIVFKAAKALTEYLSEWRKTGRSIGFVPTMGALHQGHISLINTSKSQNQLTVCSIFVNPTQFNNPDDFKYYPVSIEKDIEKLISGGCDVLFLPAVNEVYHPAFKKKTYELGPLEGLLEGHHRPGHFQGVCQVVDRLLEIVAPHRLYLGQKDFQQCMVIKKLLEITGRNGSVELVINPTIRESDGLAMSSRNLRLNPEEKLLAVSLFQSLSMIRANLERFTLEELKQKAVGNLQEKGFQIDYVEISNISDLTPATDKDQPLVALIAASIGNIRLIDNMILN